jgi:hypothetical protein
VPRLYSLSTFAPNVAPPAGFTFNQFLIDTDEPLLFHCGPRCDVSGGAIREFVHAVAK